MSSANLLYDAPGPRARRRSAIGGVAATLVVLMLLGLVVKRLADQGQFSGKLWGPLLNPSDESFPLVWGLLGKGLVATLAAATLALAACSRSMNVPQSDGWVSLFDGRTLSGWRASENPATFRVENG